MKGKMKEERKDRGHHSRKNYGSLFFEEALILRIKILSEFYIKRGALYININIGKEMH